MWYFPTLFSQYRHLNSTFKLTNGFLNVCQDLYGMVRLATHHVSECLLRLYHSWVGVAQHKRQFHYEKNQLYTDKDLGSCSEQIVTPMPHTLEFTQNTLKSLDKITEV